MIRPRRTGRRRRAGAAALALPLFFLAGCTSSWWTQARDDYSSWEGHAHHQPTSIGGSRGFSAGGDDAVFAAAAYGGLLVLKAIVDAAEGCARGCRELLP